MRGMYLCCVYVYFFFPVSTNERNVGPVWMKLEKLHMHDSWQPYASNCLNWLSIIEWNEHQIKIKDS